MDAMVQEAMKCEIAFQALTEAADRKNAEMLKDARTWLELEGVDGETLNIILGYIEVQFQGLSKARQQILGYMRERRQHATA